MMLIAGFLFVMRRRVGVVMARSTSGRSGYRSQEPLRVWRRKWAVAAAASAAGNSVNPSVGLAAPIDG
jgi:hypothetical protein